EPATFRLLRECSAPELRRQRHLYEDISDVILLECVYHLGAHYPLKPIIASGDAARNSRRTGSLTALSKLRCAVLRCGCGAMDSVLPSGGKGCGFDSRQSLSHYKFTTSQDFFRSYTAFATLVQPRVRAPQ